jgi:hypothetical protein
MLAKYLSLGLAVLAAVFVLAAPAAADWDVGDGHKMHYPQLPKVDGGWDVMSQYYVLLADDWQCSETGYVRDIHTWVSFKEDAVFDPTTVHLAIWSDDPVGDSGVAGEDIDNDFSKPLEQVWHGDTTEWTTRLWDTGDQGWFDARNPGANIPLDHQEVYQMNFLYDEAEAFWQEQGTVYWLEFSIQQPNELQESKRIGWKESADSFNDGAVWRDSGGEDWAMILDPVSGAAMDMAFVITPEPATLSLLALGGLAVLRRRRRQ